MARPAVEIMRFLVEVDIGEAERHARKAADGDIELAGDEVAQQFAGRADLQLQLQRRGGIDQPRNAGRNRGCRIGDDVVHRADGKRAAEIGAEAGHLAAELV